MGLSRVFNVTGPCVPGQHYMVDITDKVRQIAQLVDRQAYFTINRPRQYGKTTTLKALRSFLQPDYTVLLLDFQFLSRSDFAHEHAFVRAFCRELMAASGPDTLPKVFVDWIGAIEHARHVHLAELFAQLSAWCRAAAQPIVLIIDEVDSASNNAVFVDFLSQLRAYYIHRDVRATFQSVILAGVYDIKNIQSKIRPSAEHAVNSPWNIAADFDVPMSFSAADIATMLREYDADHRIGMDIARLSESLYNSTSGYPFLVSRMCQLIDERVARLPEYAGLAQAWTLQGVREAEKLLVREKNTLFDSLSGKLLAYPQMKQLLEGILFQGRAPSFSSGIAAVEIADLLGFVKNHNNTLVMGSLGHVNKRSKGQKRRVL